MRIALDEIRSTRAPSVENLSFGRKLARCRSNLDGSFDAIVDATTLAYGEGALEHIVTDITHVEGTNVRVAMIFRTRNARGLRMVREARATIDLASCAASELSIPTA